MGGIGALIKSPLNYVGGKYRLIKPLLKLFPKKIHTFVDLFAGGCNVAINAKAKHYVCNDQNTLIIELFQTFQRLSPEEVLEHIDRQIAHYDLSKNNRAGFLRLRDDYNRTRDPLDLYTLTCYSFNYQFRFNSKLYYNNPFGENRSHFTNKMRKNLVAFIKKLHKMDVVFTSQDFTQVSLDQFTCDDFFYCDPPYLITTGSYNDGNRGFPDWTLEQEKALYLYLDCADARGYRFALSNVLEHKGKENEHLKRWSKQYRVIPLNANYANSSYHGDRGSSQEVLIVNYGVNNENFLKEVKDGLLQEA